VTKRKSFAGSLLELLLIVVAAGGLALLIQAFVIKPYRIPTGSMEPTLKIGQRVLVDRFGLHFFSVHVGDIIVFHPARDYMTCVASGQGEPSSGADPTQPCDVAQATDSSTVFIKRVVGLPGDHLQIQNGHVIRNGVQEKDPYIVPCGDAPACTFPGTIIVPKDDYYVMGDNRPDSEDSRFWGPVRRSWIIGKAFFTYWPPDRIGFL
jgi:signal peptidase I